MVKVIFFNLLRSKYRIEEVKVSSGSIESIIEEIITKYPQMRIEDFKYAVYFYKGDVYHYSGRKKIIEDNEVLKITHFVGGGL